MKKIEFKYSKEFSIKVLLFSLLFPNYSEINPKLKGFASLRISKTSLFQGYENFLNKEISRVVPKFIFNQMWYLK